MRVNSGAGSGAEPETSSRARCRPSTIARGPPRPRGRAGGTSSARRTASSRPSRSAAAAAAGSKRPRWRSSPPRRSGPKQPERQPVHVEERQPVARARPRRSTPRRRRARRGWRRRRAAAGRALRPAGGAGRVDDQRGVLVVGVRRRAARRRARRGRRRARGAARARARAARPRARRRSRPGRLSVSTCSSSARAQLRVDGHERDARGERGDRRDAGLERGLGPDRGALGARQLGRQRGGGLAQLAVGERRGRRPRRRAAGPARGLLPAAVRSTPSSLGAGSQASQRRPWTRRRGRLARASGGEGGASVYVNGGLYGEGPGSGNVARRGDPGARATFSA